MHPDNPTLPWSEGFAHAFAAIVLDTPALTLGCKPRVNLAPPATPGDMFPPATPEPGDPHLAQYNEVAVAGAVWALVNYLAATPTGGLAKLLDALRSYRRDGNPARDLRDVRDSLIEAGLETNEKQDDDIQQIFFRHRISWETTFEVASIDSANYGGDVVMRLSINGPYGCDGGPGSYESVDGGLPYTHVDDCQTADGIALIVLPYLPGGAHRRGDFIVTLTYNCKDGADPGDRCAPSLTATISAHHNLRYIVQTIGSVAVPLGGSVEVGRFNARGVCTLEIAFGNPDCSI